MILSSVRSEVSTAMAMNISDLLVHETVQLTVN
jgi:hypothetical protein